MIDKKKYTTCRLKKTLRSKRTGRQGLYILVEIRLIL